MTHHHLHHQDHHHHHHNQNQHVDDASPSHALLSDLWDEFWFFQNCLTDGTPKLRLSFNPTATTPQSPLSSLPGGPVATPTKSHHRNSTLTRHQSISLPTAAHHAAPTSAPPRQSLMKAPSLPPDIGSYKKQGNADGDEDGNHLPAVPDPHRQTRNKLQRSYSSVQHTTSSSSYKPCLTPSRSHRPPRDFTLQAHWIVAPNKPTYRRHCSTASRRTNLTFRVKKWKSLTDLEHEEVQGFKDLGFVFDAAAGATISPVLLKMIPGLRTGTTGPDSTATTAAAAEDDEVVTRPYLSEAWVMQRSAPPGLTCWDGTGVTSSPALMKEKLRLWARAVASNVRQEC